MNRIIALLGLVTLLGACSSLNDKVADVLNVKSEHVQHPNTVPYVTGLILATPPVNTILFGPCKEEFMIPEGRKSQCDLHHKLRGTIPPTDRVAAQGQAMAYQPGELQCVRTLGFKTECVVVAGAPRPIYLNASPHMGAD